MTTMDKMTLTHSHPHTHITHLTQPSTQRRHVQTWSSPSCVLPHPSISDISLFFTFLRPHLHFSVPSNAKRKSLKAFSVLFCYSLSYCSSVLGPRADSGSTSHADSEQCGSVRAPHHDIFQGRNITFRNTAKLQSLIPSSSSLFSLSGMALSRVTVFDCVEVCLQLKDTSQPKTGNTGMCPMGESHENMSRSCKPNKMGEKYLQFY